MPSQIGYFDTLKNVAGKIFTFDKTMTLTSPNDTTIATLPAGTHSLAPLDSPLFTSPNIGAATGTSLTVTSHMNAYKVDNGVTIYHVGRQGPNITMAPGTTMAFTIDSGKLFIISLTSGESCIVFGSYKSATLTFLANPDGTSKFGLTSTPAANVIGIYKAANSHVVSVANGAGGSSIAIQINVLGSMVSAITAPA